MSEHPPKTQSNAPTAATRVEATGSHAIETPDAELNGDPSGPMSSGRASLRDLVNGIGPGTIIDGKYKITGVMGKGGMGVVFSATHVDLAREVALKFLSFEEVEGVADDFRGRFRREAQISAKLRNEHITRVLDVGAWGSSSYIVMEHLEGIDLRRKMKRNGGPLPLPVALNYVLQICEGMAEAHAHAIVHRDLKPANLFVTRRPDGTDFIKIMDFGISKWRDSEIGEATKEGTVLGSPKYMAPEQIFGQAIDPRADVWSIGAILFEMLSGRTPYEEATLARFCAALLAGPPPTLESLNPEVPARVAAVVGRCFERDPNKRIESVAVLAGELLDAVDTPGNTLRDRLTAIISMKAPEENVPNSSERLLFNNLSGAPMPISSIVSKVSLANSSQTVVSTALTASIPKRSSKLFIIAGVAVVALVVGGISLARLGPQRTASVAAAPPPVSPPPPMSAATPTPPPASAAALSAPPPPADVEPPPANTKAAKAAAAQAAARAASLPRPAAPPTPAPATKPKPAEDDIPTRR